MKNYFSFRLTGKKLLPFWLLFLAFFIVPYLTFIFRMKNIQMGESPSSSTFLWIPLFIFLLIIVAYAILFYIIKLTIESVFFKDKSIEFNGSFGKFIGTLLLGVFLSIITLGVYMPWFMRDIHRFFIDNSAYNSNNMKFQGKGSKLFVIFLLAVVIPMIVSSLIMARFIMIGAQGQMSSVLIIQQIVMNLILIPYMYLVYKWAVNVDYKEFNIRWKTDFWNSCGKIFIEIILTIITVGIYWPLATLRLYKYFTDRTLATSAERNLEFGYDIDPLNDFLFIWGQALFIIVTLGIYYPWAFCKIWNRVLSKTYLQEA